jgi:ankyrin repeat protein
MFLTCYPGLRSVLNAILEDGGLIHPFLELPNLVLEYRDPQGRTLFLSACRSAIGADTHTNSAIYGTFFNLHESKFNRNPFPQELDRLSGPYRFVPTSGTSTLFDFFVNKGVDLLAIDNYGKNALFQLLKSHTLKTICGKWVPFVSYSVRHLLKLVPQLVNQPDLGGNCPLHAALRRFRRHHWTQGLYTSELEGQIPNLLDANADLTVRDQLGNTALHYLATDELMNPERTEHIRKLL